MHATASCRTDFNGAVLAPRPIAAGITPGLRGLGQRLRPLVRFAPTGLGALALPHGDADPAADRVLDHELLQSLITL